MSPTAPLQQAISASRDVLASVESSQMSMATPCESWDVAGLVNHMVGAPAFFAGALQGQPPSSDAPDHAAGDYLAAFDESTSACLAGFQADGALDQVYKLPFGEMPGSAFMGLAVTDILQHGWDLAKATGQSTDIAPELASAVLGQARVSIQEAFRGDDGASPFGAEQAAPDGACAADQLAAFLGRNV